MRIIPSGSLVCAYPGTTTTATVTVLNTTSTATNLCGTVSGDHNSFLKKKSESSRLSNLPRSGSGGIYRNAQAVELFQPPEVTVREAKLEDCWQVAETHCSSFFPDYSFPLNLAIRIDRLVGLLSGFSVPNGCKRTCLVAIVENDNLVFGSQPLKVRDLEGNFNTGLNAGYVAGILTVDTVADFLPRKGPLRQRRSGIAYVSNVAVGERDRCKGIGKRLVARAEDEARAWGCRAIALHCDLNNQAAARLYKGRGFKCIKVSQTANWPQPKTAPNVQFTFMMKLLTRP